MILIGIAVAWAVAVGLVLLFIKGAHVPDSCLMRTTPFDTIATPDRRRAASLN